MGKYWSAKEVEELKLWEYRIEQERKAKQFFPTVIMKHRERVGDIGWTEGCPCCKTPIKIRPDTRRYLDAQWFPCPLSSELGHGIWGSAINITLN
jgi:hypothetical protein